MPGVQRVGDANAVGGVVSGGISSVRINGRPVAVVGNSVSAHPPCGRRKAPRIHCHATAAGGSGTVKAGGIPVSLTGDSDTCGHARAGGSDNVRAT
jgi:uncharacterized Zn-binding protein involved in type VI secretion